HRRANRPPRPLCRRSHGGATVTFEHPWLLLLALLPIGWAAWEWSTSARRLALVLKAAAFLCIALALAGPSVVVYQSKVAVAVLADTSASVSTRDLAAESNLAASIDRSKGRNWARIIPFARATRAATAAEHDKKVWRLAYTAGDAGHGT